jgi:hypothetical protein
MQDYYPHIIDTFVNVFAWKFRQSLRIENYPEMFLTAIDAHKIFSPGANPTIASYNATVLKFFSLLRKTL